MFRYLQTVALLLAVVAVLVPAPCAKNVTKKIRPKICPKPKSIECNRGIKSKAGYANIKSRHFDANFLCDTKTDGGGWIVIQRRVYKTTSFSQKWEEYKHGFGPVCGDYWLGNENIHKITTSGNYELRIDMEYNSAKHFVQYRHFHIDSESHNYTLHLSPFSDGTVRDSFMFHNNMQFSTPDRKNDKSVKKHCGRLYKAGWWYHDCHTTNLNGQFNFRYSGQGIVWQSLTGIYRTLSSVEMKIRQVPGIHTKKKH